VLEEAERDVLEHGTPARTGPVCRTLDGTYRRIHARLDQAASQLHTLLANANTQREEGTDPVRLPSRLVYVCGLAHGRCWLECWGQNVVLDDSSAVLQQLADELDNLVAQSQAYMDAATAEPTDDVAGGADPAAADPTPTTASATPPPPMAAKGVGWLERLPWIGKLFAGDKSREDALERLRTGKGKHSGKRQGMGRRWACVHVDDAGAAVGGTRRRGGGTGRPGRRARQPRQPAAHAG
jgi:hypothetical protein